MALTKVTGGVIQSGTSINVGVITATTIQVGSAVTIHTGGYRVGSTDLHSSGLSIQNINATGVITATSFIGDISQATGAAAGLGTALSQTQSSPLNKLYYTNRTLSVGSTVTVDPPASASIAYTQYQEIVVEQGADLIVEDGDDLVTDVLGLSTGTPAPLTGAGGRVRADQFTNKTGTGAPTFPNGVQVTGVSTATSFSGNLTGNVTGNVTGNLTGNVNSTGVSTFATLNITQSNPTNLNVSGVSTFAGITTVTGTTLFAKQLNVSGVVTATSFVGDGSALTGIAGTANVSTNSLVVSGVSTLTNGPVLIGSGTSTGTASQRLQVTGGAYVSGNLGVGTIDAKGTLHVAGTTSITHALTSGEDALKGLVTIGTVGTSGGSLIVRTAGVNANEASGLGIDGTYSHPVSTINIKAFSANYAAYSSQIAFQTQSSSSSPTTRMLINSQGELLVGTQTRTANGGVLQVSNGITFPATQSACSDPNTLDDYEEGTWTPKDQTNTNISSCAAYYTKVGRFVHLFVSFQGTYLNGVTEIRNFPFTGSTTQYNGHVNLGYVMWASGSVSAPFTPRTFYLYNNSQGGYTSAIFANRPSASEWLNTDYQAWTCTYITSS